MRLGIVASAVAMLPPVISYVLSSDISGVATTYTFTDHPIGAAAPSRLVVVCIQGGAAGGRTITSVTIGGVAATIVGATNASSTIRNVFAYLAVPAGTTATIVVNSSASLQQCRINVYSITGLQSSAPIDAQVNNTATATTGLSLTAPEGAAVIAGFSASGGATATTWSWAGSAENHDAPLGTNDLSVASKTAPAAGTEAISATGTGGTSSTSRLSAVAWS